MNTVLIRSKSGDPARAADERIHNATVSSRGAPAGAEAACADPGSPWRRREKSRMPGGEEALARDIQGSGCNHFYARLPSGGCRVGEDRPGSKVDRRLTPPLRRQQRRSFRSEAIWAIFPSFSG